ncbi:MULTISPECIES: 7-cyano-7-deazaguanine synthase [unclassified Mesorhizobium]|uniref:7-cyano-7-deazaguanine synthase n=1 Tax=unclassified Mesorhizobium TaxID=325217 RepID=UPI000BB044F5|nr:MULTISPECIES: 7-cyano-7-deazaguanine synthase [unclassified Mesorhizobium]PBB23576.1 7-cyano-7-deazaguanine synthase [Mesorhizobium sp. WSM4304]PBB72419.1 7-cyano-7-deazaguanine synthase [Mesorhizobium sp. WSM4308]
MKALLFSGGLDSSAIAWWLKPDLCVTIDYGQRSAGGEMAASRALCEIIGLNHRTIKIDLSALGSGSMAGKAVAAGASASEFWPYRNQMLVTIAAMKLMPEGVNEIILGSVSTDRHADGKAPFLRSLDRMMSVQEGGVRVTAPARKVSTVTLLKTSAFPYSLIGLTFSCHVHEFACGQCSGCTKHRECVERAYGLSGGRA